MASASPRRTRNRASGRPATWITSWNSACGSGQGNKPGEPIPIGQAADHIAGYCLLNDRSARDIQGWEYQPLGPVPGQELPYHDQPLDHHAGGSGAVSPARHGSARRRPATDGLPDGCDRPGRGRAGCGADRAAGRSRRVEGSLSRGTAEDLYWTAAQMVAHHASGGCNLRPGDLFGSGTISGARAGSQGSLLEITEGGRQSGPA